MKRYFSLISIFFFLPFISAPAQRVRVVNDEQAKRVDVFIEDKPFTSFCYPENIEKPFLFPVYAPNGTVVTRGFPIAPRPGERKDHPHQIGLWFNYGDVNGIDFWGNSSSIKAEEKDRKGHIVVRKIVKTQSGIQGSIEVISDWKDSKGNTLLTENSTYIFSSEKDRWTIDHIATLTAATGEVTFTDTKEGMFAIRVDRVFEMPSNEQLILTDIKDITPEVLKQYNSGLTGMYHSSSGKSGDAVWGTRNSWVILSGKKDDVPVSMAIFDNPENPGFPAFYHARGYGLFSVNNMGGKSYDPSQKELVYKLAKGESVKLVHRFCVQSGKEISTSEAENIFKSFSKEYK